MGEDLLGEIVKAVDSGDMALTDRLTRRAVDSGFELMDIVEKGLNEGMKGVGEKFERGEYFLCELLTAADAMKAGLAIVEPLFKEKGLKRKTIGRVVMGTVQGDIHDIGKSIVATTLSMEGFELIDLGFDVPNDEFVKAVEKYQPNILGMSSLLSVTRPRQQEVIELLRKAGLRDKVKVMIGGAITSQEYCEKIGADAYAADAIEAVATAKNLLGIKEG